MGSKNNVELHMLQTNNKKHEYPTDQKLNYSCKTLQSNKMKFPGSIYVINDCVIVRPYGIDSLRDSYLYVCINIGLNTITNVLKGYTVALKMFISQPHYEYVFMYV